MTDNKNTSEYWDKRFGTGDWSDEGGRDQTRKYAETLVEHWSIEPDFAGTVLDFGCALGEAIPVYKAALPKARFIGLDHSGDAVGKCRTAYGDLAEFRQGDHSAVPEVDVIIASHILEHVTDDLEIARTLLARCRDLYIVVPYREDPLWHEHVRSYDEARYDDLGPCRWQVYDKEPFKLTWSVFVHMHLKNLLRPLFGKKVVRPAKAIMYHFSRHD